MSDGSERDLKDVWEIGDAYESFMGRWSRLVAMEFLHWLSVPRGCAWLDVGCGTGMLSRTILEWAEPSRVTGIDQASGFIAFAKERGHDPRASFSVGSVDSLPLDAHPYDAVVSGLVLNFLPDAERAVSEMMRVTRPGGVVAAYVWDYAGKMQLLRCFWDAVVALDARAVALDEGTRFPLAHPGKLSAMFTAGGLKRVEVQSIDVPTHFVDFEDYWTPFLSGQGPAPGYVASLYPDQRIQLREKVRSMVPVTPQGTIDLIARAWAIRGYV